MITSNSEQKLAKKGLKLGKGWSFKVVVLWRHLLLWSEAGGGEAVRGPPQGQVAAGRGVGP